MSEHNWSALDRRTFLKAAGAAVALGTVGGALAACGGGSSAASSTAAAAPVAMKPDGDINVFNWAQYMDPKVISDFEAKYGIKVHQTYFDNMDSMMAKLNAGVMFDVIFPENAEAMKLVQAGKLLALDHAQLTSWSDILPYFADPWYDPGAKFTAPYSLWTTGIGWHANELGELPASWDTLWNTPKADGKLFLLDDAREVIGMSLMRLGLDPNSTNPDDINKATDALLTLMPQVRGFSSVNTQFINNTAWMQEMWSGQAWQAISQMKDPQNVRFASVPNQTPLNNDTIAIPANAEHPGSAMLFLDWVLSPQTVGQNISYTGYPQATKAGVEAYNTMTKDYAFLALDANAIATTKHFEPLKPQDLALWNAAWLKIKAA